MGAASLQSTQNFLQHRLRFLKHLIVPEPEHPKSFRFNSGIPLLIVASALSMLPAIKLDHKPRFDTREIGDIAADGNLATETVAADLPPAEVIPKMPLGIRRLLSKFARPALCDSITHVVDYRIICPLPGPPPRYTRKGGRLEISPRWARKGD
jgi:hypothetical protein